jgi:WD40 repeat protein
VGARGVRRERAQRRAGGPRRGLSARPAPAPTHSRPIAHALPHAHAPSPIRSSRAAVRTAKFVPRKQWIVAGADDMMVRVYNYNTMDKVRGWGWGGWVSTRGGGWEAAGGLGEGAEQWPGRRQEQPPRERPTACSTPPCPSLPLPPNPACQVRTFEAHTDYIRSIAVHPSLPFLLTSSDDMLIKLWDWDKAWACVQVFEGHSHYVMQVGGLGGRGCEAEVAGGGAGRHESEQGPPARAQQRAALC